MAGDVLSIFIQRQLMINVRTAATSRVRQAPELASSCVIGWQHALQPAGKNAATKFQKADDESEFVIQDFSLDNTPLLKPGHLAHVT